MAFNSACVLCAVWTACQSSSRSPSGVARKNVRRAPQRVRLPRGSFVPVNCREVQRPSEPMTTWGRQSQKRHPLVLSRSDTLTTPGAESSMVLLCLVAKASRDTPGSRTLTFGRLSSGRYDPDLGRWLSEDPIRLSDGPNMYSYISNQTVSAIDPLGLKISCVTSFTEKSVKVTGCQKAGCTTADPANPDILGCEIQPLFGSIQVRRKSNAAIARGIQRRSQPSECRDSRSDPSTT